MIGILIVSSSEGRVQAGRDLVAACPDVDKQRTDLKIDRLCIHFAVDILIACTARESLREGVMQELRYLPIGPALAGQQDDAGRTWYLKRWIRSE